MSDSKNSIPNVAEPGAPALGQSPSRRDGHAKVTGTAQYSADWPEKGVTYAVIFQSSIAAGKIRSFDLAAANEVPGVIEIITHENAKSMHVFSPTARHSIGDTHLPLQDDKVLYHGQPIGVVVAETLEAAEQA